MHFRIVKRDRLGLTITLPCGDRKAVLTKDTTKDPSMVTCKRCLDYLKNQSK
jgi:hypothetical protein